jgi:hypothetical protein
LACLCRGAARFPFFLTDDAFSIGASSAVAWRPSVGTSDNKQQGNRTKYAPACSALSKSTSFGTLSECHRSKNSAGSDQLRDYTIVALSTLAFLDLLAPAVVVGFDFVPKHHSKLAVLHRSRYKDFSLFF